MEKKKIILIVLLVLAILAFPVKKFLLDKDKVVEKESKSNIKNTMNEIVKDVNMVSAENMELNKQNFEEFSFIPWKEGIEAIVSEGLISTNAHSMVLIKTSKKDGEKIAKEIASKANPRKWICVGSETAKVLYTDDYVFLVMTFKDTYNSVAENFKKVAGEYKVLDVSLKSE